jgi:mRNA interferase HigB
MHILKPGTLEEFWARHPSAEKPLKVWLALMKGATVYKTPQEVKDVFGSCDFVGKYRVVFNIGGNNYRLVADVVYPIKRVFIKGIFTHAEYDKIDVKEL